MQNYREELEKHHMRAMQPPAAQGMPVKRSRDKRMYYSAVPSAEVGIGGFSRVTPPFLIHIGATEYEYMAQNELFQMPRFYDPRMFDVVQHDEQQTHRSQVSSKASKRTPRSDKHTNKRQAKESKRNLERIECKFDNMEIEENRHIQAFNTFVLNNVH